jgi:hypothetical protein
MQLMMMQLKVEELKGKVGAQEVEIQRLTERTEQQKSSHQDGERKLKLQAGISAKKKTNTQAKQNADRDSYKQPTHEIRIWKIFANIHKLKTMANEIFEQTQEMKPVFQLDTCPLQSKLTEFLEEIETLEKSVIAKDPSTGRAVHEAVEYSGVTSDSAVYSLPSSQST